MRLIQIIRPLLYFTAGYVVGKGLIDLKKLTLSGAVAPTFDSLFVGDSDGENVEVLRSTSIDDTLGYMHAIAKTKAWQVAPFANYLRNNYASANILPALFDTIMANFRYKDDARNREQVRTPLRSVRDRHAGIDCDCFSVFIGAVLENFRIPYVFRVVMYKEEVGWQHVYCVAKIGDEEVILDPVMKRYNYEKPYLEKKDYAR